MADAAIDSQTPLVNAARHGDRAALQRLLLRVDRDVRQYVYRRLPDGSIEGISPDDIVQDVLFEASVNVAQLRADGDYRATVGSTVVNFHILAGDANRDRRVEFADPLQLARDHNWAGRTNSKGNFDYSTDGRVDISDLLILAQG